MSFFHLIRKCELFSKASLLTSLCSHARHQESLVRAITFGYPLKQLNNEVDKIEIRDATKDRSKVIPVEISKTYLQSNAYKETYGDGPVWVKYRRNHKGMFPPKKTRKTCIRQGTISTGNPCPICRDEYLVLDHRNIDLLTQFISPYTGEVLSYRKTGLCQKRYQELLIAVERAKDYGFIIFDVPFRVYDYAQYSKP